jgi:ABC-type cobalamin/Fe3+-siderophores transport system ATPase subunit
MKILELKSENVKRIKAVTIRPDGNVVIIGGENGSGKTSTLDSIWYALGGKNALPPKPVREGEEEATITLDLGDLVVTRTITPDGKGTLKVAGKDGGRYPSPQTILDNLVGNLSFDPLAFSRMDGREQVETLKGLVGLDFSALDRKKAAKSEDRVLVGREVKQLAAQVKAMPQHAGAPSAEVSVAELSLQLKEARGQNTANDAVKKSAEEAKESAANWMDRVVELKAELEEAEKAAAAWQEDADGRVAKLKELHYVDEQAILDRIANAEGINRQVRDNQGRVRLSQQLEQKEAAYEALSNEIHGIDNEKARALEAAKFPVESLSFDELGVLVNGVPFQQASAAEQLRISVAMGCALNPKLKVLLVRDASLLDAKSLQLVAEMAEKHDAQVWLERVGDGDASAVIIEDGQVAARSPRARKAVAGGVG